MSLFSLMVLLGLNALLMSYEVYRLKEHHLKLSYLIYLDLLGIFSGGLFIWILSKSVVRPMKKMVEQIKTKSFVEPHSAYGSDEIGDLARAVSLMKRTHSHAGDILEEKNQLIEAILDHSVDCIFLFNREGEILSYSRSFQEVFALSSEDLEHLELSHIIPSMELKEVLDKFSGKAPQKNFYIQELLPHFSTKRPIKMECSICPVSGKRQDVYVGIIRHLKKKNRFKSFLEKIPF